MPADANEPVSDKVPEAGAEAGETIQLRASLDEARQRLLYLQAEVENVRKAAERERAETVRYAAQDLLERLLPALDELDAAVAALPEEHARGVGLVRDNLRKTLEGVGLRELPSEGTFDPWLHEAVQTVAEPDRPEGSILRVLRKGYSYEKRVLRPAQVAVVKR